MADKVTHEIKKFIDVPVNIEDNTVLKRFLTELTGKLNGNALVAYPILYPNGYNGPIDLVQASMAGNYLNSILEAATRADTISGEAKNYITGNLLTVVLSNEADLATIVEEFGTFYNQATAAAWYGLTVKAGQLISGFTVSGVDSDTTTPGAAGSIFAINANTFTVARAIEDISDPSELAYVQAHDLPYGTMYNTSTSEIIPTFLIEWNGTGYDIFFNGKATFSNIIGSMSQAQQASINTAYLTNGAGWTDDTTATSAVNAASNAQDTANTASANATSALAQLADIASDNILSPVEKPAVTLDYLVITTEQSGIDAQATNYGITTEKTAYDTAISDLTTYLNTLTDPVAWDVTTDNTTIVGATFKSKFSDVYTTRQTLLNKIAAVAKSIADGAQALAAGKPQIFRQPNMPGTSGRVFGDLWFDTDNNYKAYIWDAAATSWEDSTADAAIAINNGTTTVNGSQLTTGTVTALQIAANTIVASRIAAGTITATQIAANTITALQIAANTITAAEIAVGTITATQLNAASINAMGITAGSVAAENITGTTISGKAISAGTIVASKAQVDGLKVFNSAYPANTAPMTISQFQSWSGATDKTLTFYGASYSTGHRADRFVASTTKFMIDLTITTPTAWASSFAYIDVTISGSGITTQTIRVRSQNPSISLSLAASLAQASSISFSVAFTTSGAIETPVCTFRAFGFNTE